MLNMYKYTISAGIIYKYILYRCARACYISSSGKCTCMPHNSTYSHNSTDFHAEHWENRDFPHLKVFPLCNYMFPAKTAFS